MAVITIDGLTKRFGEVVAVDNLSFEVDQGTVVGFLGPNGAGKTTTLRMLLGLVTPTAGSARIDGKPYRALAEPVRQVGAVLEASSFHPGRSARNHLRIVATAAGLPLRRADEVLRRLALLRRPAVGWVASRSACASAWGWPPPCSATPRC